MNQEKCCEKNCPDYNGMEILHSENCDCSCHTSTKEKIEEVINDWNKQADDLINTSPKEEDTCPHGATDCNLCNTSPKEEIVNDWESDFRKKYNDMDVDDEIQYIHSLLSSTEKRVAKEIIGDVENMKFLDKNNPHYSLVQEKIISKIKSKYE